MKKLFAVIIMLAFAFSANADMMLGICDSYSRKGWEITDANRQDVLQWLEDTDGDWYSHISCVSTFGDYAVAFAVTLEDGSILSEDEVYDYLGFVMDMGPEDAIEYDSEHYGIIEGVFAGQDNIAEAVELAISIHDKMESKTK